jgi:TRAP-type C4-dicarboxylate transport system permease small subunit
MKRTISKTADWVHRRSQALIGILLGVMFCAFIIQIVFRYFFNLPTGWSTELTLVCWLWIVLWGTAFALKESDEIRFDLVYSAVGPRTRRVMIVLLALAIIALYGLSLPASYSYVSFMKVEKSSYLHIRLDYLYSIYIIFLVAVILRYLWILWQAITGQESDELDSPDTGAAP